MNDDELARIRNEEIGFVFQTFNLLPRATALHNVELPLIYAGVTGKAAQRARPTRRSTRSSCRTARATGRTSCRAVSASAWPSRARSSTTRRSCWPTSRPATSIRRPAIEIMALFARLHEGGNTIVLVTHEADVAAHAHRTIHIRDGQVEKEESRTERPP